MLRESGQQSSGDPRPDRARLWSQNYPHGHRDRWCLLVLLRTAEAPDSNQYGSMKDTGSS